MPCSWIKNVNFTYLMKISVILPSFKPGDYLWDCLISLNNQTISHKDFEVLLILNGDKEPFFNKIETFISKFMIDIKVNLYHTSVTGVSNARNIGIDNAQGEYICFIDDDDFVSTYYLEDLLSVADPNTIALSNVSAFIDGKEATSSVSYSKSILFRKLQNKGRFHYINASKYFSGPCMKLISKNIIGNRRFDVRFHNGEDSLFMFLISDKINMVCMTEERATYYRRIRNNSAFYKKKPITKKLYNLIRIVVNYNDIFFRNIGKYNMLFYVTRVIGSIKGLF